MTMPRRQLGDVAVTRYYHCISRCVRRAFLCGEGVTHRKAWIEARLELLAEHFAVAVYRPSCLDGRPRLAKLALHCEAEVFQRKWPSATSPSLQRLLVPRSR